MITHDASATMENQEQDHLDQAEVLGGGTADVSHQMQEQNALLGFDPVQLPDCSQSGMRSEGL